MPGSASDRRHPGESDPSIAPTGHPTAPPATPTGDGSRTAVVQATGCSYSVVLVLLRRKRMKASPENRSKMGLAARESAVPYLTMASLSL